MKIYEILTSYMSVEVHHVKANNEDEALKQFHNGESRHSKTYDDEYDDLVQAGEDGPWKLADYTEDYGEFK
jgi:hypothetical protein